MPLLKINAIIAKQSLKANSRKKFLDEVLLNALRENMIIIIIFINVPIKTIMGGMILSIESSTFLFILDTFEIKQVWNIYNQIHFVLFLFYLILFDLKLRELFDEQ